MAFARVVRVVDIHQSQRPNAMSPTTENQPQQIHFLLLPEFSVMGFVSAIEPLRVANRFRAGSYRWQIVSVDGGVVHLGLEAVARPRTAGKS